MNFEVYDSDMSRGPHKLVWIGSCQDKIRTNQKCSSWFRLDFMFFLIEPNCDDVRVESDGLVKFLLNDIKYRFENEKNY